MKPNAQIMIDAQLTHIAAIQTDNQRLSRTLESPFLSCAMREHFLREIEANQHKIQMLRQLHQYEKVA